MRKRRYERLADLFQSFFDPIALFADTVIDIRPDLFYFSMSCLKGHKYTFFSNLA